MSDIAPGLPGVYDQPPASRGLYEERMGHPPTTPEPGPGAGGSRELLKLALPLIVSNSFLTLQLTIDRVMLSRQNSDAVGAAMVAAVMYWTPFALLQFTASYAATFVAQYVGAGRPQRVG